MDLFPHQERLLGTLAENDSFGIFWAPRVMKTLPVCLHATNLIMRGEAESCLVVAPKSALGAWKRDLLRFKGKRAEAGEKFDLINYESVWRRKQYDKHYDIVILDESHRIANRTSKQTKFCLKYNKRSKYRYILSGTPIGQGRLEDLYTQMEFLFPNFWGPYREFEARYCITRQLPSTFVRIVVGYRNKEELLSRVTPYVSSLTLDDIADLPTDPPDNIVVCPRPNQFIQSGVKEGYVKEYDILIPNPVVKLAKLRQVASGFIIDEKGETHTIAKTKRIAFGELLDEIGSEEKFVVFCEFKHSVKEIRDEISKRQLPHAVLDGSQADKEIWRWFQEKEHMRGIVCQYRTANAGIDLWTARHMIFYEPSLSTQMIEQARNRIKTAVNPRPSQYHWLIAKDTVELKIYKQLRKHKDFTIDCMSEWSWASEDKDEDFIFDDEL
jgi:SNF2 family DNA or RNA helicase